MQGDTLCYPKLYSSRAVLESVVFKQILIRKGV